jgi:hypothetical protein
MREGGAAVIWESTQFYLQAYALSEAAEERDEYKARLNTATETIKRLEAEIAEWRLASGVEGPLFLKYETAGKSVCSHSHS